jgi:hypothetical protein
MLMMRCRDVASHPEVRRVRKPLQGRVQRLRPDQRVRFHDFEFTVAQPSRLQQHAVWDAHLANVMQRTCAIEQPDILRIDFLIHLRTYAELLREHAAVTLHALKVSSRFRIARFRQFRQ